MAKFKLARNSVFSRTVEIFFADQSQGELEVQFEKVTQEELMELLGSGDMAMLDRVLKGVADIEIEGTQEVLRGADALQAIKSDPACVAALAADYMNALKGGSFRGRGARKGR